MMEAGVNEELEQHDYDRKGRNCHVMHMISIVCCLCQTWKAQRECWRCSRSHRCLFCCCQAWLPCAPAAPWASAGGTLQCTSLGLHRPAAPRRFLLCLVKDFVELATLRHMNFTTFIVGSKHCGFVTVTWVWFHLKYFLFIYLTAH